MNAFDAVVILAAVIAIVFGFRTGLLRSVATILGYLCAAPVAVKITSLVSQTGSITSGVQTAMIFCAAFAGVGFAMAAAFRTAVSELAGAEVGVVDRLAGSALGAVRVSLIAVTLVMVFDRIIPAGRDPAFLASSILRPFLSVAGRTGLQSLPPATTAFIDQIKTRSAMYPRP